MRSNVIEVLRERGLVNDVTSPKLEELAAQKALKVYCGFDPTADSLHLGNLLGIIVLSWFQVRIRRSYANACRSICPGAAQLRS